MGYNPQQTPSMGYSRQPQQPPMAYNPQQYPQQQQPYMPNNNNNNNNNVVVIDHVVQQPTGQPQIIYVNGQQPVVVEEKKDTELEQLITCWSVPHAPRRLIRSH